LTTIWGADWLYIKKTCGIANYWVIMKKSQHLLSISKLPVKHKALIIISFKKKWKIQGGNRYFRTYNWRSLIPRARREIKTYCFLIKNNATSQKKLWDIQQEITCYNRSFDKIKIILVEHYRKIWSLDRPWKSQIFPRTTQTQWLTSKIVSEVARLHIITYPYLSKDKHESRCFIQEESSRYDRWQ